MKKINLFLYLLNSTFFLYAASAASGDSENKKIAQEVTVISQKCSRFHLDALGSVRSEQMEFAGNLVSQAMHLHERSVVAWVRVGEKSGIGIDTVSAVFPRLRVAQMNEKCARSAILYSSQRLLDAINGSSCSYVAPPLESDIKKGIDLVRKRRASELSASYIRQLFQVESYLKLDEKICVEDLLGNTNVISSDRPSSCCRF